MASAIPLTVRIHSSIEHLPAINRLRRDDSAIRPHWAATPQVKPAAATKPVTATAEPEVEKKSPTVIQIRRSLFKMGKDKKRHPQLMQIANDALYRLTWQDRGYVICTQLLSMTPEERDMVYASLDHMMKKEKPDQLGS